MERYSKKRESILSCLRNTDTHPNAEWVYQQVKPIYPDLSLGTVYRNLRELKDSGCICSIGVVLEKERFDARTEPHTHVICERCGTVTDLDSVVLPKEYTEITERLTGFEIKETRLLFSGICKNCRNDTKVSG